ncbi:MAG: sterol desaturase family protein [Rhodospirillales bacterium]|nr:sterol desaturase family protein [Rhodospirillales bacterium]
MSVLLEDIRQNKGFTAWLSGLTIGALALGIALPFVFAALVDMAPIVAPLFKVEGEEFGEKAILVPFGMLAISGFCLILETWLLGYEKSTLKKILMDETPSVRTDFLFLLFRVSGLMVVFGLIFSFGGMYVVSDYIEVTFGFAFVRNVDTPLVQFVVMALVFSFLNYWVHRLMHTPILWEIHKVHHSAEDYNVLLPYRNHPVDFIFATFYGAFAIAVLGVTPEVLMAWLAANAVYQSMVHSMYDWRGRWLEYIFITPAAHRIHHSTLPEHFDTNFGIFSLWDRMFGTYYAPKGQVIHCGIPEPDQKDFNTGHFFAEILSCFLRWIRLRRVGDGPTA